MVIKKEKIGNINTERIINANNEPQNWLSHGRDYHEQRYSPLNQVNLETINKLELEWSLDMGTKRGLEATPIIDNGIMFVSSTWSVVHAVDAKTGKKANFGSKKTIIESFKTNGLKKNFLEENSQLKYKLSDNNILKFY